MLIGANKRESVDVDGRGWKNADFSGQDSTDWRALGQLSEAGSVILNFAI